MMNKRDKFNDRRRSGAGFTLVELMVTVSILVILLAVGVPEMRSFMVKQQVKGDAERLAMALQLAKSEALKRSGRVSICPLPASGQATCVSAATADWSHGWLVFVDASDQVAGTPYEQNRDTALMVEQGTRTKSVSYGANRQLLSFQANGLLNSNPATFTIGQSGVTDGVRCKALTLNRQGRLASGAC